MYLEFTILSIKENVILFLPGHPTPVSFKMSGLKSQRKSSLSGSFSNEPVTPEATCIV